MPGVTPTDFATASPDWPMNAAIRVKSPFSHNAWFGFVIVADWFVMMFSLIYPSN
jgi:hypothetical protein